jgi:D-psicose/D-tagatose/L-ribulose 3-epimerase
LQDGNVVIEPFVNMGGQVGKDIYVWRDISQGAADEKLDSDVARSVEFLRRPFAR